MENDFFSPREFRSNDITEEDKEKLRSIYTKVASRLDNQLGREATFGDFIKSQIEQFGYDRVDELFEGFKYAWNLIGRDVSDYDDVFYNNITLALKDYSNSNSDKIAEIDSIVNNATSHSPYIQEDMYNDSKYSQIEDLQETKVNTSKEVEDDFKW